jgi:hypothetical protein
MELGCDSKVKGSGMLRREGERTKLSGLKMKGEGGI